MRIISLGFAFVAVAIVSVSASCDNPLSSPDQSVLLGVSKIDAPATVAPGTAITVVLTVTTGGCVSFDHVDVNRDASSAFMIVWGHDAAKGRNDIACTADIREEPHSYQFSPPFANSFAIQVARGRLSPLQATVQVQ
jgi:hypothetical protein